MENDFINDYMHSYFEELTPYEFYRGIFPPGELETSGTYEQGKYNAIAVELLPPNKNDKTNAKRYIVTDGMEILEKLLESENFIIISPITYSGKSRLSSNARFIYAIAIDLDGVESIDYLTDLWHQVEKVEHLPRPTYTVTSGTGLHLYYVFEKPIPCFNNITKQLAQMKTALTKRIWNQYTTTQADKPQIQSLFQGFRLVGGVTKSGKRTRAYETGKKIDIEYLNEFVPKENMVTDFTYKSNLTLSKAKELYPQWYEKRIEQKQKKGTWICKRDLYDWWKRKLIAEIKEGHRFNGIMVLAVYAKKCNIGYEELEQDAFSFFDYMESLTVKDDNHFLREDIITALEMYNDDYMTYPIHSIVERTDIPIQKNKRNGRKQSTHLKIARSTLEIMNDENGKALQGRKAKREIVLRWKAHNPGKRKTDCIKETGLSKPTVYKYWQD